MSGQMDEQAPETVEDRLADVHDTLGAVRALADHCWNVVDELPMDRKGDPQRAAPLRLFRDQVCAMQTGLAALAERGQRQIDEMEQRMEETED